MTDEGVLERITPYDFQEADVAELLAHNVTGFVTAETGAGKSVIGVEAAIRSNAEVILVVAIPDTFEDVWVDTIMRQDPTATVKIIEGTPTGKLAFDDLEMNVPGFYLVSHQVFTLWKAFEGVRPDLAIIDEAHMLGSRHSKGGARLLKLKALRRLCMSGTMARNRFENLWLLLRWVYPDRFMPRDIADISPNRWIATFCETRYDEFAVGNIKVVGELNPGALAGMIPCYIQHFKREHCCEFHPDGFLSELPAPVHITYDVDLLPEQKKMIKQMEAEYVAWLHTENEGRDGKKKPFIAKLPIVKRIRLRQMALGIPTIRTVMRKVVDKVTGLSTIMPFDELYFDEDCLSAKLDLFMKKVAEHDENYVTITSSKSFAEETTRRLKALGVKAELWDGDIPKAERKRIKDRLREGETRIIVAVVASISTGIDGLQHGANRVMILDRDQDLTTMTQFFGRLDRRGQTEQVIIEEIVARGSFDKKIIGAQLAREIALAKSLNKLSREAA